MKRIFLDMDGTLARFNVPNALNRFNNEEGFFANLKAYKGIEIINQLCEDYSEVYIISASPDESTDNDKIKWLDKYLPDINIDKVLFCRLGENKAKEIERRLNIKIDTDCYLLDDYTKNLQEWEELGGTGIKRITHCSDNSTKKWKGLELKKLENLIKLFQEELS